MIETDILIIGAGPAGLFTVFEAGLLKMRCHIIDALPQMGGQLSELYPKKPIFDIPGFPSVLAGNLIDQLYEQIRQFEPSFTFNETAVHLLKLEENLFEVITDKGTRHRAKAVIIAGGLGSFEPKKPPIENIADFEEKGVSYFIKRPEDYAGKHVVIAGGGDSALDWSVHLAEIASSLTLIHRRNEFRGALDSVEKVKKLKHEGKINLITPAEVIGLEGNGTLQRIIVEKEGTLQTIETDHFIPLFGLVPKLGPLTDWGLELEKNAIKVDNSTDFQTSIPGVYAVGDINTYPYKMKLILCGFHETAIACQSIYQRLNPNKKFVLKYTTVSGVEGFDGSKKQAEKQVVATID
ncbi:NAD(P)/FAD-dependent oxidoreductase [Chryseobacterium arthrosphaerae]|uniref:NAD(P)/FAD-dependent oxidoreductase n=1 Tax=Chryseobacterium arthrosphaerae TaxID=651561 RepID=UPI003D3505F5